jgi:hypothetical protein
MEAHMATGSELRFKDQVLYAERVVVNGSDIAGTEVAYVDGLTPGTALASKALVVDSSIDLAGLNNLSMTGDLTVDGAVGTGTATPAVVKLTTPELTVVDADQLGRIDFLAPLESSGTDAILVGASIWAEADDTFSATVNDTDLVFATGLSEAATEKMRLSSSGELTVTSAAAASLSVGRLGATTPAFVVDSSTGSQAAGLKVTGAATGGTVAVVAVDSGAAANLTVNAKGTGTIGIGSVSTGAVTITPATTVTGAVTPTGGVAAAGGFALSPRGCHTGGASAMATADGSDATPVNTETYIAEVFVPYNCTVTGIAVFNGSVASGNITVKLANSSGVPVGTQSASTAMSGTDTYQLIPLGATYAAVGPATYLVLMQVDNSTARINCHTVGVFGASKKTSEVYGTFTTVTPPTTFTTALGPIATLY